MSAHTDTHIIHRPTSSTITSSYYLTRKPVMTRSTSSATDGTCLTSHHTRSSSPAKTSQTNNIGARPHRPSFAKATTSKLVNMVPSLSKKMTDIKEQSDGLQHYITDIQSRQRRNSLASSKKEMVDLSLSYHRQQPPSRRLSLQVGTTQSSNVPVDRSKYNSNKHRSVLNPTIQSPALVPSSVPSSLPEPAGKKQHQRLSRDLSPAITQSSRLSISSKQNKTETPAWSRKPSLRVATPPYDSNSDSDDGTTGLKQQHQHHHQHHQPLRRRRTSINAASIMAHNNPSSLLRRRSMADLTTSPDQRLLQAQARLRPPSWLESAGFMRQSKCAMCHPEPPTTSVLSPPIGIGVPAFGSPDRRPLPSSRPSIDPLSTRSSLAYTKDDTKKRLRRTSSPLLDRRCAKTTHHRSFSAQLDEEISQSPSSLSSCSTTEGDLKQLVTQFMQTHLTKEEPSLTAAMMDDLLHESDTKTLEGMLTQRQVNSVLSSATLVNEDEVDALTDFAQKLRSILGRWFTDLNHGRLERYETAPDGTITTMTITGSCWLDNSKPTYTLTIGQEERRQVFRMAREKEWTADDQVLHCQFKNTKTNPCDTEFDWVNRRHHCRRCGDIFCKAHSMNRLPLFTDDKPNQIVWSRVCDSCCHHLVGPYMA